MRHTLRDERERERERWRESEERMGGPAITTRRKTHLVRILKSNRRLIVTVNDNLPQHRAGDTQLLGQSSAEGKTLGPAEHHTQPLPLLRVKTTRLLSCKNPLISSSLPPSPMFSSPRIDARNPRDVFKAQPLC